MADVMCERCGQVYSSKYTLARHRKNSKCSVNVQKRYECVCGHWTAYKYNYTTHINKCKVYEYKMALDKKEQEMEELEQSLSEKDQALFERDQALFEKDQALDENDKLLSEKDLILEEKDQALSEKEDIIRALKAKITERDKKIMSLNLKLANSEGKIEVYKERPGVVNNTQNTQYGNNKLLQVKCDTIRPFTIETVREEVQSGKYTFDQYIRAERGLVEFIAGIISQDEQRSYVCTDTSRHKFHRLLESREWQSDNGATFLNKVFDELVEPSTIYYNKICSMMAEGEHQDMDMADMLMQKTRPMFFGITQPKSSERPNLFNKIRNEVRTLAIV